MKKVLSSLLCSFTVMQGQAQYKFAIGVGVNMPYTTHLNNYLTQANLKPLEGLGVVSSLSLANETDDLTNYIDINYFVQG